MGPQTKTPSSLIVSLDPIASLWALAFEVLTAGAMVAPLVALRVAGCGGGDGVGEGENDGGSREPLLEAGVDPPLGSALVEPRRTAAGGGPFVSIGVGVDRERRRPPMTSPLGRSSRLSVKLGLDKEGFEPVVAPSKCSFASSLSDEAGLYSGV